MKEPSSFAKQQAKVKVYVENCCIYKNIIRAINRVVFRRSSINKIIQDEPLRCDETHQTPVCASAQAMCAKIPLKACTRQRAVCAEE